LDWITNNQVDGLAGTPALPGVAVERVDLQARSFAAHVTCLEHVDPHGMHELDLGLSLDGDQPSQPGQSALCPRVRAARVTAQLCTSSPYLCALLCISHTS
jgi:hypothetical protein